MKLALTIVQSAKLELEGLVKIGPLVRLVAVLHPTRHEAVVRVNDLSDVAAAAFGEDARQGVRLFAYPGVLNEVRVGAGDVDGDGFADIITAWERACLRM